jgi:hypothetical protein
MDGDVVVRSTLGAGSTFVLVLPLAGSVPAGAVPAGSVPAGEVPSPRAYQPESPERRSAVR